MVGREEVRNDSQGAAAAGMACVMEGEGGGIMVRKQINGMVCTQIDGAELFGAT